MYSNLKSGDRVNVRYNSLIQYAEVMWNNNVDKVLTLRIIVGGCCGSLKYENKSYAYDSFDLRC
jgi:hypothetical protein